MTATDHAPAEAGRILPRAGYRYADLRRLMALMTGDEKHDPAATSTLDALWVLYDRVLREVERPLIVLTLGATRGNQIKAAHLLGLNRNTLRKKIRELDIPVVRGLK